MKILVYGHGFLIVDGTNLHSISAKIERRFSTRIYQTVKLHLSDKSAPFNVHHVYISLSYQILGFPRTHHAYNVAIGSVLVHIYCKHNTVQRPSPRKKKRLD